MKKPTMHKVKLLIFCATLIAASSAYAAPAASKVGDDSWRARMQLMLADVVQLLPFAFDETKFVDPKNAPAIEKSLSDLSKHSVELKQHTAHMDRAKGLKIDPSFPFIAEAFERDLAQARQAFSDVNTRSEAQTILRSALAKCTMCHSQSAVGPTLQLKSFNSTLRNLPLSDRLMALTVTRQFDEALVAFQQYAKDAKVHKPKSVTFDKNVRAVLAVAVRVKRDPVASSRVIDAAIESGAGSTMLQTYLVSWKTVTANWRSEKIPDFKSDQALFDGAKKLTVQSQDKQRTRESYVNEAVTYLRASGYLHDLLSNYPESKLRAESYILLASIYESLPGFAIWDLGDEYLGSCIQENPHSAMGERCYGLYNDSVVAGYTGSSGTHLPSAVREHLTRMKTLAQKSPQPESIK